MFRAFFLIIFFYLSSPYILHALPKIDPYYIQEDSAIRFIYSDNFRTTLLKTTFQENMLRLFYEKSFNHIVDDKITYIFISENDQTPNAFTTVIPRNMMGFYAGCVHLMDEFGGHSILLSTLSHEMAHIYGLHPQGEISYYHRKVFGNLPFFLYPIIPIPIVFYPNVLLPSWIVEGNAVLNESSFKNGGRLYHGGARALVYSLIKDRLLSENNLTNETTDFPYRTKNYLVGGYFQSFLAQKFGLEKTNQFFTLHGRYLNPFLVNSVFLRHFGSSYSSLIAEFLLITEREARDQKGEEGDYIASSQTLSPLNGNEKSLFFLTSDLKSTPFLNILNRENLELTKERRDLPLGKIFLYKNNYVSLSYGLVDHKKVLYTLWGEGKKEIEGFRSRYMIDYIDQQNPLYIDIPSSLEKAHVFGGKTFEVYSDSFPIADSKDSSKIYYFKQKGEERLLYENETILFKYKGYTGQLIEANEGQITFLAPTLKGQGLFLYDTSAKECLRLFQSDTIVDARSLSKENFLLTFVTSKGYNYRLAKLSKTTKELPAFYDYPWSGQNIFDSRKEEATLSKEKEYIPVKNIEYNAWNISGYNTRDSSLWQTQISFSDPSDFHHLSTIFSYAHDKSDTIKTLQFHYQNSEHLLQWGVSGAYRFKSTFPKNDPVAGVDAAYPLWQRGRYSQSLMSFVEHPFHSRHTLFAIKAPLSYKLEYEQSFFPYKLLNITPSFYTKKRHFSLYDLDLLGSVDLSNEWFLSYAMKARLAHNHPPVWGDLLMQETSAFPTTLYLLDKRVSKGLRNTVSFKKAINEGAYSKKFPLSLRKVAPEVIYSHHLLDKKSFDEYGGGVTLELLLGHLLPFPLSVYYLKSDDLPKDKRQNIFIQTSFLISY